RVHLDGMFHAAEANVGVRNAVHESTACGVGLDAEAVVGAVDGEVVYHDVACAAISLAADGHAMAAVEVVVRDGHVRRRDVAGLDGYVVVTGVDEAPGDGDV